MANQATVYNPTTGGFKLETTPPVNSAKDKIIYSDNSAQKAYAQNQADFLKLDTSLANKQAQNNAMNAYKQGGLTAMSQQLAANQKPVEQPKITPTQDALNQVKGLLSQSSEGQFKAEPNKTYYNQSGQSITFTPEQLQGEASGILNTGWSTTPPTDTTGTNTQTNADGTTTGTTGSNTGTTGTGNTVANTGTTGTGNTGLGGDLQTAYDEHVKQEQEYTKQMDNIMNGQFELTSDEQAQVNQMRQAYDDLIAKQKVANENYLGVQQRAGIASGRDMYTPGMESSNLKSVLDDNVSKIRTLETKALNDIAELRNSFKEKDYKAIEAKYKMINDTFEQKRQVIADTNKAVQDELKAVKDKAEFEYKKTQDAITNNLKYADLDLKVASEELASNKFNYQQKQDYITNILANEKQTWQQKQDLIKNQLDNAKFKSDQSKDARDYALKLKEYSLNVDKAAASDTPTSYKEWQLAGGNSSGKSYADFLLKKGSGASTRALPMSATNTLSEGKQIPMVTQSLTDFLDPKSPNYKGNLFGPVEGLKTLNPYDVKHKTVDDDLRRAAQVIGKYMEGGVLRKEDEAKYAKMLPQLTDTLEVAKDKLTGVKELLRKKSEQYLDDYESAGFDVSGFKGKLPGTEVKYPDLQTFINSNPDKSSYIQEIKKNYPNWSPDDVLQFIREEDPASFSSVGGDTNRAVAKVIATPDNTKGGQCGRFVNQITGLGVGDSYKSKMAKMDPSIKKPEAGMVFTMPYKNTGHVGFIVAVNGNIATVKDSNYSLDQKVKTHQIPVSKMTGFTRIS